MTKSEPVWTVPVAVDDVPEDGLHMEIEAPDAVRADIVKLADLRDLPALSATFELFRKGAGVHVTGTVRASVGQICVVTLDPMETVVEEPIDLLFAEGAKAGKGGDEPEPLLNGTVDLGALATEFLLLGIDPYPRKPGVEFAPPKVKDEGEHPFAALAALKKRPGGGQ
jgi:uncharacterized metal-binding protein YceD (DUF177 family)